MAAGEVSALSLGEFRGKRITAPFDLNDAGLGVGVGWSSSSHNSFPPHLSAEAWLLYSGSLIPLPDLVVDWGPFNGGFADARGINNRGEIVGEAEGRACIAIPVQ